MLQWRMWLGGYPHNLTCMLMRVCGWVHARVCILVCVLQNPQTFFYFYCVITRFLPPRLKDWLTSPISIISEYNVQETVWKSCSFLSEALDFLWSSSRDQVLVRLFCKCNCSTTASSFVRCDHNSRKWWKQMEILFLGALFTPNPANKHKMKTIMPCPLASDERRLSSLLFLVHFSPWLGCI